MSCIFAVKCISMIYIMIRKSRYVRRRVCMMRNEQLSRSRSLKMPKIIPNETGKINNADDLFSARQAYAMAEDKKFKKDKERRQAEEMDAEWEQVSQIPEASSDLIVITRTKKLGAYIIAVTQKSPAKFRGVFVNRMQNFCLAALEDMLSANFVRQDSIENKKLREKYQTDAIIKLKMLGYIAMVAENAGCILTRQYKQISAQLGDVLNLTGAWRKSDDEKWRNKQ